MKKKGLLGALFLVLFASFLCAAGDETARIISMPKAETTDVIQEWFQRAGFAVSRIHRDGGTLEIHGLKGSEEWVVSVKPHSPLASEVRASFTVNGSVRNSQVNSLWNFLTGYARGSSAEVEASNGNVPGAVLAKTESIVCINAKSAAETLQFSGFVVDTAGLILCTAHNLGSTRKVRVTFSYGKILPGKIIKIDPDRDIALIDVNTSLPTAVSLAGSRRQIGLGERIFSVGCPESLGGTVYSGFVNGSPRLVNRQRLLQVSMKVYPGSSGSPVFDASGNLVAMVKGRFRGTDSTGFLIPHETILAFIRDRSSEKK